MKHKFYFVTDRNNQIARTFNSLSVARKWAKQYTKMGQLVDLWAGSVGGIRIKV